MLFSSFEWYLFLGFVFWDLTGSMNLVYFLFKQVAFEFSMFWKMVAIVRHILVKQAYLGYFRSVFSVSLHILVDCRNNILGDGFSGPIEFKKFHWACFPNFCN